MTYALMHIPKTGGTALKSTLRPRLKRATEAVEYCQHSVTFPQIVGGSDVRALVFVRDPVARFVSAFNSRKRKGQPRHNTPWTPVEAESFERFSTPNDLAEALSSTDKSKSQAARKAMRRIPHLKRTLAFYLDSPEYLDQHRDRIGYVGTQETLDEDMSIICGLLGLSEKVALPDDPVAAHKALATDDTTLSNLAERNLREWYAKDYEILSWCLRWRQTMGHATVSVA